MKMFLILLLFSINAWAESDTDRKSKLMYEFMKNCKELGLKCTGNAFGNTYNYNTHIIPPCDKDQQWIIVKNLQDGSKKISCEDKLKTEENS